MCFSDTQRSRIETAVLSNKAQHYCLHIPFCWMQISTANYNHHVIFIDRDSLKVPTPPSSSAEKRLHYLHWSLEKAQLQVQNKEKCKIKVGYNDRMKKTKRYIRQKFGSVEHKYIFSEICKVSGYLSTSFAVQPKSK